MDNAFCILAAGRGTRARTLGMLHKTILPLKNTTVLTHIIEKCPPNVQIVIAVGYQKEIIKEYCAACHSDRDIVFVDVDNYDGPGSGPGYSLHCCKEFLQRPFYLCCSDCLLQEQLPTLDHNWLGVQPITDPINWSTAKVENGKIVDFKNKSLEGFDHAWIGVAGIKDHQVFWSKLGLTKDREYEAVSAFYNPLDYGEMIAESFTWFDTGTSENYKSSVETITGQSLGMAKVIDEVTCQYKGHCVKIFGNKDVCKGRIDRADLLKGLIPPPTFKGEHVYAYKWVEGSTLYEHSSLEVFDKFLNWCRTKLWYPAEAKNFSFTCNEFYQDKTLGRFRNYLKKKDMSADRPMTINGMECEPIEHYLAKISTWNLIQGIPVRFHGDLQPENVIVDPQGNFHLIDWRDTFGGHTYGDLYYDLAKLNGGLGMCYDSIKKNKFHFCSFGNQVDYHFDIPAHLHIWQHYYENWLAKMGYDLYKVRVLTALIYLNMSPLHVEPFDELLFNHSKWLLSLLP